MNPYDFVRCDWNKPPERKPYARQNAFTDLSGSFEGTIVTETPLFIPDKQTRGPVQFQRNRQNQPIIPGTSLKGLFRSLIETIAPGCWWFFDEDYRDDVHYGDKLPEKFRRCRTRNELCPACRMFGLIEGKTLLAGNVGFADAVCSNPQTHAPIFTPILDTPKPRHGVWYLDSTQAHLAGRKFYFHAASITTERELKYSRAAGVTLNQHIHPLAAQNEFVFSGHFNNLREDELQLLLYAINLEPTMRHKIGYAKPAGFGSIRVALNRVAVSEPKQRYSRGGNSQAVYEKETLAPFLATKTQRYIDDKNSVTLKDLRRIWAWPPAHQIRYPNQDWFRDEDNRKKPIAQTP